jgi:hypothetical protein
MRRAIVSEKRLVIDLGISRHGVVVSAIAVVRLVQLTLKLQL